MKPRIPSKCEQQTSQLVTALLDLPALARQANVSRVLVKCENERPLGNFKSLGGRLAGRLALNRNPHAARLICASDGNHGLAIAYAAWEAGVGARIYLPAFVSRSRAERISDRVAEMVGSLAAGAIDGFCAGEPWGSRAVDLRVGRIVLTTGDIWLNHPEKVLAFTEASAAQDPDRLVACVAAVISASSWLDAPENQAEAAHILSRALPTVPEQVIALALNGLILAAPDSAPTPSPRLIFQRNGASYPFPEHGAWWLSQMRRWGHAPFDGGLGVTTRIWRPDLWRRAAAAIGEAVPVFDIASTPPGVPIQ